MAVSFLLGTASVYKRIRRHTFIYLYCNNGGKISFNGPASEQRTNTDMGKYGNVSQAILSLLIHIHPSLCIGEGENEVAIFSARRWDRRSS